MKGNGVMAIAEIKALYSGVRAVSEIANGIISLSKNVAVNQKASELIEKIIGLQNDILLIQEKYEQLSESKKIVEEKLANFENWEEIASRYLLEEISPGVFTYVLKKNDNVADPKHWLCPKCFEDRKKSILQLAKERMVPFKYICLECQNAIYVEEPDALHKK
jgi:hypothetical protein